MGAATPARADRQRSVLHLNVADFAVAVERARDPGLRRRPLIVAQAAAARCLVYDMSEEAFRAGVRKHMPLERALKRCPGARVVPPQPHSYERAMAALLQRARPFSPLVEAEEISGHLFLDLSGTRKLFGPPQDVASRLRRAVRRELGLDPIWALARNKLVSKAASRVVKPVGEIVVPAGGEQEFLRPLPLHLLPGVEPEDLLALSRFNLFRVEQALAWEASQLRVVLGRRAGLLHQLLRGLDDSPVLPADQRPPRVACDHQFAEDTNDPAEASAMLWELAARAGAALRRQGRAARRVVVSLDYSDGGRVTRARWRRAGGTANDFALFGMAHQALEAAWGRRIRLRHLRLVCDCLAPPPSQMELFAAPGRAHQHSDRLLQAMDQIRARHGWDKIKLGRALAVRP